jgi:hypothetical protein
MNARGSGRLIFAAAAAALLTALAGATPNSQAAIEEPAKRAIYEANSSRHGVVTAFGEKRLRFEANRGQAPEEIQYLARWDDYTLLLGADGVQLAFRDNPLAKGHFLSSGKPASPSSLRLRFLAGQPSPSVSGIACRISRSHPPA